MALQPVNQPQKQLAMEKHMDQDCDGKVGLSLPPDTTSLIKTDLAQTTLSSGMGVERDTSYGYIPGLNTAQRNHLRKL